MRKPRRLPPETLGELFTPKGNILHYVLPFTLADLTRRYSLGCAAASQGMPLPRIPASLLTYFISD